MIDINRGKASIRISYYLLSIIGLFLYGANGQAFELGMPVGCRYGTECFIQNYVDWGNIGEARDYTCGLLTYNRHDGTDFRLKNKKQMEDGVAVLAAAEGIVKAIRDGEEDRLMKYAPPEELKNKECGNGIVVTHAEGWETQYCHLKKHSVQVTVGQKVKKGETIAQVGLSGQTTFPHVHLTVRHESTFMDPFTGQPVRKGACGGGAPAPLWDASTRQQLAYIPTALLNMGFSDSEISAETAAEGYVQPHTMPVSVRKIIMWADMLGIQVGDQLVMDITGPDGNVVAAGNKVLPEAKAYYFQYIGKKLHQPLKKGNYRATFIIQRNQQVVAKEQKTLIVE